MILTSAETPDEYVQCLSGWQQAYAAALRCVVLATEPSAEERLKWGHIVYFLNGPVLLIRAEPTRVLFGFWRGKRLRHIEPRLKAGGKYELATLELREGTPLLHGRSAGRRLCSTAPWAIPPYRLHRAARVRANPSLERGPPPAGRATGRVHCPFRAAARWRPLSSNVSQPQEHCSWSK
jgi:hypothetical protein